ncbi:MAG: hypothetical protein A2W52_02135 [Candidatus Taylorbacteria bacterium RIFCSPHIGHO2_02_49_25]|uniref:Uncharacterized protein n=1 Tax=Candidatus Taylorbacteria bacterium RIFCSPHIGHO2_02_49_25 TaxID=1802305 RepID=A0A1G2MFC4_9BACT|nr:MAG: hypothetical protein A2759_04150 [Candidatus Taylorbacteria bacterium RIFCSPHIGHO2_01_FULL_49_60]OHA21741.1 MAG: hypothetical protein A2W52_02135 [Candidatus Taylorbacteria bacterium RIFCSPHIGHO2_02_49_25]OHA45860.1 MAG: hypothetical protein A3G61_03625 [Candidatus Taylorbacteria bacterium RIFCSPLOWO2_12_FULL_49_67]
MDATVSFGHHARIFKEYCQVIQGCAFRVAFKHLAHKRSIFLVDANRFGARVVEVADRGETGVDALPRFLS